MKKKKVKKQKVEAKLIQVPTECNRLKYGCAGRPSYIQMGFTAKPIQPYVIITLYPDNGYASS